MRAITFLPFALLALAPLLGCSTTQKRTYSVAVVNGADEPVVLWMTKDGPPPEPQWLSPGQWEELRHGGQIPGDVPEPAVELPPGRRVDLGPQAGRFERDTAAVLLVYSAPVTLAEMSSTPRRTSLMDVVFLAPGQNYVMVRQTSPVRAERVSRLEGRPGGGAGPAGAAPGGPP